MEAVETDINVILAGHRLWLADDSRGKRAEVVDATLNDTDFRPGPWDRAIFDRSTLIEADFSGCSLVGSSFIQTHMERCSLTSADLSESTLVDAHFDFAVGTGVMLCDAKLVRASF